MIRECGPRSGRLSFTTGCSGESLIGGVGLDLAGFSVPPCQPFMNVCISHIQYNYCDFCFSLSVMAGQRLQKRLVGEGGQQKTKQNSANISIRFCRAPWNFCRATCGRSAPRGFIAVCVPPRVRARVENNDKTFENRWRINGNDKEHLWAII